jgi:hypothetical protein
MPNGMNVGTDGTMIRISDDFDDFVTTSDFGHFGSVEWLLVINEFSEVVDEAVFVGFF